MLMLRMVDIWFMRIVNQGYPNPKFPWQAKYSNPVTKQRHKNCNLFFRRWSEVNSGEQNHPGTCNTDKFTPLYPVPIRLLGYPWEADWKPKQALLNNIEPARRDNNFIQLRIKVRSKGFLGGRGQRGLCWVNKRAVMWLFEGKNGDSQRKRPLQNDISNFARQKRNLQKLD